MIRTVAAQASCLVLALTFPAVAQSVSATQTSSVGAGAPVTVTAGPSASPVAVAPVASDGLGDSVAGHTYGSVSGALGSSSSGAGVFDITGTADYAAVFTNTTGVPVDLQVSFVIDAGQLAVSLPAGADGVESASLSALLTGNGATLSDYESSMTAYDPGFAPTFSESGATLNASGPTLSPGAGEYDWPAAAGVADAGVLLPGQSETIEYTLTSAATGTAAACPLAASTATASACVDAFASARIGDPISASGPDIAFVATAVPEPGTAMLLLGALAALAVGTAATRHTPARRTLSKTSIRYPSRS